MYCIPCSTSHLEQAANLQLRLICRPAQPRQNGLVIQTLGKVHIIRNPLDRNTSRVLMENSSHLDKLVHRSFKVIRASCTIGHVEGSLALGLSRGENLKDVYFATARLPAGAFVVLRGAGNAAVQRPDGRHVGSQTGTEAFGVGIGAALAVEGHLEVEEEDLVGTSEALCAGRSC